MACGVKEEGAVLEARTRPEGSAEGRAAAARRGRIRKTSRKQRRTIPAWLLPGASVFAQLITFPLFSRILKF